MGHEVYAPDGQIIVFPDDMSDDSVNREMTKLFGSKESQGPSLGHTAGVMARSAINGVAALPLAALDAGAAVPHALGWAYNKLSPGDWQKLTLNPSVTGMLNMAETAAGAPEPKNKTEQYLGAGASGIGASLGGGAMINAARQGVAKAVPSLAEALMNTYRGVAGGIGAQVGADAGGFLGQAAMGPQDTFADYTGNEIGSTIGANLGGISGGAVANRQVPTSPQAGMTALMDQGIPVSSGQVGGGALGNRIASVTPLAGYPLRRLAAKQNEGVANILDIASNGMNAEQAGQAIQSAAQSAREGLSAKGNELYAPYTKATTKPIIDPITGEQTLNPLGKPAVSYPDFSPTKSYAGAQYLLENDPGNPAAKQALALLKDQRDTNSATGVKSTLQAAASEARNSGDYRLSEHYGNLSDLINQDIMASNEQASPGSSSLLAQANKNYGPIKEAKDSLLPITDPNKDESAASTFLRAVGTQKKGDTINTDTNLVRALMQNNAPEITDPLAAYTLRTLSHGAGQISNSKPETMQLQPLAQYLQNTKNNNPDIYSSLFDRGSTTSPLSQDFLMGLEHIGLNPAVSGMHLSSGKSAGLGAGAGSLATALYEHGLVSPGAALGAVGLGALGTGYSAFSASQPLARLYNQVPRGNTSLADVLMQQLPTANAVNQQNLRYQQGAQ